MIVKELIEKLKEVDQNSLVVTSSFDHSYREVFPSTANAEVTYGELSEYYEDQGVQFDGKVIPVIIFD